MPFNGSGTFVRAYNWVTDKINGVNITASRMDTDSDGFASGLTNCITRDGQGKATATQTPATTASYDLGSPSLQWRNAYLSGTVNSVDSIEPTLRIIKNAQQVVTNSITPVADTQLQFVPVATGAYIIEFRMLFTANATAQPGGLRVGPYATFINANCQAVTGYGNINSTPVLSANGSVANGVTSVPTYAFGTLAAGSGANWLHLTVTLNILNLTGSPVIGIAYCQNSATPGGNLTAETPCFMRATRVS